MKNRGKKDDSFSFKKFLLQTTLKFEHVMPSPNFFSISQKWQVLAFVNCNILKFHFKFSLKLRLWRIRKKENTLSTINWISSVWSNNIWLSVMFHTKLNCYNPGKKIYIFVCSSHSFLRKLYLIENLFKLKNRLMQKTLNPFWTSPDQTKACNISHQHFSNLTSCT